MIGCGVTERGGGREEIVTGQRVTGQLVTG